MIKHTSPMVGFKVNTLNCIGKRPCNATKLPVTRYLVWVPKCLAGTSKMT